MAIAFPQKIYIGDDLNFVSSSELYPAETYSLRWIVRGEVAMPNLEAAKLDKNFQTSITSTWSAGLTPGKYHWQGFIFDDLTGARTTAGSGTFEALVSLSIIDAPYSKISEAEIKLQEIEEAIRLVAQGQRYRIKDRELERAPIEALLKLKQHYKWELAREKRREAIANGLPDPSKVHLRVGFKR